MWRTYLLTKGINNVVNTCNFLTAVQINTVVSGALDRLHYEKDPCVKYDVNRKLWIYLHRNREEIDFGEDFIRCFWYTI